MDRNRRFGNELCPRIKPEGTPERSPEAGKGVPSGVVEGVARRFSAQRKMAVVARLLRGEPLEVVARETNVPVSRLTEGRDRAIDGAATFRDQTPNP
jgi:hypothetical protein